MTALGSRALLAAANRGGCGGRLTVATQTQSEAKLFIFLGQSYPRQFWPVIEVFLAKKNLARLK